jgi:hypothetical protein
LVSGKTVRFTRNARNMMAVIVGLCRMYVTPARRLAMGPAVKRRWTGSVEAGRVMPSASTALARNRAVTPT